MYVALTRARDRLYVGTVLKDGVFATGRGSLADVLPESFRNLFVRAAQEPSESIGWTAESGRVYEFRICRALPDLPPDRLRQGFGAQEGGTYQILPTTDFFAPLTDSEAIERVTVTDVLDPAEGARRLPAGERSDDDALVGTLVHRMFQFAAGLARGTKDAADLAARLIRPEERAMAADADASVTRAIHAWTAMTAQPGVTELLESGEAIHELQFSSVADGRPARVLRGMIDCLVRRADGSIVVVEFKTGAPSPAHQTQLDLYVRAARAMFPESTVTGRVVYPR